MTTFFTSDLHFGHKAIMTRAYPYRLYPSIDEMDEAMIYKWNQQVWHSDQVYIIGDVSFHKAPRTVEILQHLNGQKFLIKGNHDHTKNMTQEFKDQFQAIHKYHEIKPVINGEKQLIVMSHFPFAHWNRQHYGSWHLHGHLHGSPSGVEGKIMDVGWDAHGRLLTLEYVSKFMATKPVRDNHHECGGID